MYRGVAARNIDDAVLGKVFFQVYSPQAHQTCDLMPDTD